MGAHRWDLSLSLSLRSPSLFFSLQLTWVTWWILMCRWSQLDGVHGGVVARGRSLHCGGEGRLWLLLLGLGGWHFGGLLGVQRLNRRSRVWEGVRGMRCGGGGAGSGEGWRRWLSAMQGRLLGKARGRHLLLKREAEWKNKIRSTKKLNYS